LLIGGVLIGPHVLGLAETSNIQLLANIGLGFLFLLAGYELDPGLLRQRPGTLAILGWLISAVLAVGVTAGLGAAGYVRDYVPVGLALTTTALGTLLPILRDHDMLSGPFGQYVYAAGAAGELFPILIIAVFLTGRATSSRWRRWPWSGRSPSSCPPCPGWPGAARSSGSSARARMRPGRPRCAGPWCCCSCCSPSQAGSV
jgi:Kef-type K+ transport system membrane component KefB